MQSISFVPSVGDLIAANRLHFWSSLRWRQTVRSYVLGGLLFAVIGTLFVLEEGSCVTIVGAALGFLFWSLLLVSILALNYILIPRRSRHAFCQMRTLQSETYINWSPQRIQLRSAQGSSDFDWRDFVRIAHGRDVILLFQSDYLFNFIPMRVVSGEQATDLLEAATERRR